MLYLYCVTGTQDNPGKVNVVTSHGWLEAETENEGVGLAIGFFKESNPEHQILYWSVKQAVGIKKAEG